MSTLFDHWAAVTSTMRDNVPYPAVERAMRAVRLSEVPWDYNGPSKKKASPDLRRRLVAVAEALGEVVPQHRHQEQFGWYLSRWQSDCFAVAGEFRAALDAYPVPRLGTRASMNIGKILSLKLAVGEPPNGFDLLTLFGPKVTAWARKHLVEVAGLADAMLREDAEHRTILPRWAASEGRGTAYDTFSGRGSAPLPCYGFLRNEAMEQYIVDLARAAEDVLRKRCGVPAVGEGWVEETALYYALKEALPECDVHHHYTAFWLGRQHIDIYIEDLNVAVEYQGVQHDRPVEFFGGEAGFRAAQERDARKRRVCAEQGVRLLEVRPGYRIDDVLAAIREGQR